MFILPVRESVGLIYSETMMIIKSSNAKHHYEIKCVVSANIPAGV